MFHCTQPILHLFIQHLMSHTQIHTMLFIPAMFPLPNGPNAGPSKVTTKTLLAPQSKIQDQHQGLTTENGNMNLE